MLPHLPVPRVDSATHIDRMRVVFSAELTVLAGGEHCLYL